MAGAVSELAFIDTAVIAYARYDAPRRPACTELLRLIAVGRLAAATSVLVLEEVWHLEHRGRPPLPPGTARAAHGLFTTILDVRDHHLRAALEQPDSPLGTADRLHAAVALDAGCDVIVTTDGDFDGVPGLARIDPEDRAGLERRLTP